MNPLFILEGKVQKGKSRGKKLGFPTANISIDQNLPEGIYISQTKFKDQLYTSLTFIGTAKTYNENIFQSETYILDFDKDIYGELVTVYLLKKIRENKRFDSEDELIKQMEKDKKVAYDFFQNLINLI